jgi:plastocyanin
MVILTVAAALAGCGGGEDTGDGDGTGPGAGTGGADATESPSTPSPTQEDVAVGGGEPVDLKITIELNFTRRRLVVPPGAEVSMTMTNKDPVPHNFSVYVTEDAEQSIFVGERTLAGTITYEFGAPVDPGTYYFQCDIHPVMNGDFVVE